MINPITFDTQMAMAGAMSSILAARGGYVNESVEAQPVQECGDTQPVQECGDEGAPVNEAKKPNKGKSVKEIVSKFRKDFAAKKFGNGHKVLKTCKGGVCECGSANVKECDAASVAEADEDVARKAPVKEIPAKKAVTKGEADDAAPEADDAATPIEDGDEPGKEVVAHASAVSERIASMRDKLVAELDADDGLELGTQKSANQDGGQEIEPEEPVEA